jgi:hypothetical protein
MTTDVAFFLAPDDESAAAVRARGPGPAFAAVHCHHFDPDDAVVEWEMYFEAPSPELPPLRQLLARTWPTWVAPIVNDGTGVFVLPDSLVDALAHAEPAQLGALAARWTRRLREADGDDMTDDDPLSILEGVARLAATAVRTGEGLYCRHY